MAKKGKGKDKGKSKKSKDLRSSKASTKTSAKDAKKSKATKVAAPTSFTEALRVGPDFVLADLDPRSTPGFDGDKADGEANTSK